MGRFSETERISEKSQLRVQIRKKTPTYEI